MLVLLLISLYTSRLLLQQLGIEDFGVYNLVGSIIALLSSLRGLFASSTQRFLNFEMGKGQTESLQTIFNMSVIINIIISIIFVISVEALGYWFFNYKINIDPSRYYAAVWVFHISVVTSIVTIMTTPFDAVIIANERMGFYAYISIIEGLLKLAVIFLLICWPGDKLITYAVLLFCVSLLIRSVNAVYCRMHFPESHYKRCWDKNLFKNMSSFAGWNFFGNMGFSLCTEGINMLLNIFGGPIVNAARGITYQVKSAMEMFIGNVNKATDPYATKLYAKNDFVNYNKMMFFISKVLFFAYTCLAVPLFFFIDEILILWLGQIPKYAPVFIRLILIHGIIRSYLSPLNLLFYSANKVKYYQISSITISIVLFLFSWFVLQLGLPIYSPFVVMVIFVVISWATFLLLAKVLCNFPVQEYLKNVTLPTILALLLNFMIAYVVYSFRSYLLCWFVSCIVISSTYLVIVYYFGFNRMERKILFSLVNKN